VSSTQRQVIPRPLSVRTKGEVNTTKATTTVRLTGCEGREDYPAARGSGDALPRGSTATRHHGLTDDNPKAQNHVFQLVAIGTGPDPLRPRRLRVEPLRPRSWRRWLTHLSLRQSSSTREFLPANAAGTTNANGVARWDHE
jgi:hypothetical protein